ncbi:hypothetical protein [Streptomyces sp. NPDC051997]|uniref:hypothetical protein n=1 Tax=Streptomyces sp. NPDC051997 TaxID=3155611 RepID=UPI003427BB89
MPDPSTTRLALYKSKSDGSELVSYTQDIGQNLDKLDAAAGFQIVTSSTRPSSPYSGKPIAESDTSYRTYFSNGTSPASASWVEIPNSSGVFGGNLSLASGSSLSIGAATLTRSSGGSLSANTNYQRSASASTDVAYSSLVTADTFDRVRVYASGLLEIGPGNAARDTNLFRDSANVLRTNDSLTVDLNLSVAGSASVTGNLAVAATTWTTYTPTVTNGGSVTWTTRTGYYYKLGKIVFVCVYLNVNAVGTGTGIVSIDMPSNVDRTARQALTLHAETIGANGNATSSIRGGECVFFTGGTGATSDRLRVDNGTSNESNIQGADLLAGGLITVQGWYREA